MWFGRWGSPPGHCCRCSPSLGTSYNVNNAWSINFPTHKLKCRFLTPIIRLFVFDCWMPNGGNFPILEANIFQLNIQNIVIPCNVHPIQVIKTLYSDSMSKFLSTCQMLCDSVFAMCVVDSWQLLLLLSPHWFHRINFAFF